MNNTQDFDEVTLLREEARLLGVPNYWSKSFARLKQEVANAKSAGVVPNEIIPDFEADAEQNDEPVKSLAKKVKQFEDSVKAKDERNRKIFAEAAKEEGFYAFASPKGDRIGLFRKKEGDNRRKNDVWGKDSSFEFVKWSE